MMNRSTGGHITAPAHLRQSVVDILTTPIGSRVMRRDYGSLLQALVDQPDNKATAARVAAACAAALMRWEPRLGLLRINLARGDAPGRAVLTIAATVRDLQGTARPVALQIPIGDA